MVECNVGWADGSGSATFSSFTTARHSNGSNFAMCGGHTKWYMAGAVSSGPGLTIGELQAQYGGATADATVEDGCNNQQAEPVEYLGNSAVAGACKNPTITFNIN
jgi:prepilin-type processing-associated H-X9-DG protein